MNHSTSGLPVYHQLQEFTQTHVCRVGDAIQPSHPLLSPSPLTPILPSIRIFSNESTLCMRWPKYWSFSFNISPSKEHSGLISLKMDWLYIAYCHPAYLTSIQSTSWETLCWRKHKIAGRNINNLKYADDTTLMAESEVELKSLLMQSKRRVKKLA